ncbi:MAG: patatin-like phospholipase family protein, partial [Spirochaetales bacterium]|nr:patatin-like phospholipase family protein [Spirochaetales bacterium]
MKRRTVGLALGGGGARGLAHIGVLQCLEEAGVPIDCVTGTSVGSLIGALLVCGYDGKELERRARDVDWSDLVGVT